MKHCAGQTKYLIAISELLRKNGTVRCINISEYIGVSRPSVSKMLRCLADSGLVCEDFCNSVRLTDQGKAAVSEIDGSFREVYTFFRRFLKLPPDAAHEQAVTFISNFPQDTCNRLKSLISRSVNK